MIVLTPPRGLTMFHCTEVVLQETGDNVSLWDAAINNLGVRHLRTGLSHTTKLERRTQWVVLSASFNLEHADMARSQMVDA